MKYLVVLLVVCVVVWMLTARARPGARRDTQAPDGAPGQPPEAKPQAMLRCAHCGLHLPAADAVLDGSRVYCSDAHRLRGPGG